MFRCMGLYEETDLAAPKTPAKKKNPKRQAEASAEKERPSQPRHAGACRSVPLGQPSKPDKVMLRKAQRNQVPEFVSVEGADDDVEEISDTDLNLAAPSIKRRHHTRSARTKTLSTAEKKMKVTKAYLYKIGLTYAYWQKVHHRQGLQGESLDNSEGWIVLVATVDYLLAGSH